LELGQSPLYFCGVFEACANAPPNPGEAARNSDLIFQLRDHVGIFVGVEEAKREGQPLPAGNDCQDIEQKNEQIIRVPHRRRERFVVDDLKVNQPRPAGLLVIDNVSHCRVAVRPPPGKFIAPELMRAEKLAARRFQHLPSQGATVHVFPKAFTG
jgi:hypothetical protein